MVINKLTENRLEYLFVQALSFFRSKKNETLPILSFSRNKKVKHF